MTATSNSSDIFLDTTVFVALSIGDENERRGTQEILERYDNRVTSTFIRLEFKGSVIQDMNLLYRMVREEEAISRVLVRIGRLQEQQRRRIERMLKGLALFMGILEERDVTFSEAADKIEAFLRIFIDELWVWFSEVVDGEENIIDGTGCVRAKEPPRQKSRGSKNFDVTIKRCYRENIQCSLNAFFTENAKSFNKILNKIKTMANADKTLELSRAQEIIERCLKTYPTYLCSQTVCRRFADAIIVVEACPYDKILSKNNKEFRPLCEALSKTLITHP